MRNIEIFPNIWGNILECFHCTKLVCLFFISEKGSIAMQAGWYTELMVCVMNYLHTSSASSRSRRIRTSWNRSMSHLAFLLYLTSQGKERNAWLSVIVAFDTTLMKTYILPIESSSITNLLMAQMPFTLFGETIRELKQRLWLLLKALPDW